MCLAGHGYEKVLTVKLGGSTMDEESVIHALADDILSLLKRRIAVVIVHGGGKEISREMQNAGIATVKVGGLRVTDDATMAVVEKVMERINDRMCRILQEHSVEAQKVIGADGLLLCKKLPPMTVHEGGVKKQVDLGRVGFVEKVDPEILTTLIEHGAVPVVSPIGRTPDGQVINVNADTAAGSIAGACADEFILLTDVEGVIVPGTDGPRIASKLDLHQVNKFIDAGVIREGMMPKVEACVNAIENGVKSARIVYGLGEHPLLEAMSPEPIGTQIVP
jgi:acetylglutamate kinase